MIIASHLSFYYFKLDFMAFSVSFFFLFSPINFCAGAKVLHHFIITFIHMFPGLSQYLFV